MVARGDVARADAVHRASGALGGGSGLADVLRRTLQQAELLAGEELRIGDDDEAVAGFAGWFAPETEVVGTAVGLRRKVMAHDPLLRGRRIARGGRDEDEARPVVRRKHEAARRVGGGAVVAVAHHNPRQTSARAGHRADTRPGRRDVRRSASTQTA